MSCPDPDLYEFGDKSESVPKGWEAGVEIGKDTGTVTSGPVDAPVTDWDSILLLWNLDPEYFEVIEPVTFKAWDGFAKETNPDGTQVAVSKRLFSYKATIKRISPHRIDPELIKTWHKKLTSAKVAKSPKVKGDSVTYVIAVADAQIGKKGTEEAIANWTSGITAHVARVQRLQQSGYNIKEIILAFQGDEHEQVVNNYGNQPHTVELNLSEQIEADFSLRVWSVERVASLGIPVVVTSVISNHGEWTRNGGKDVVTTKADNSSTCVARLVEKLVVKVPALKHVSFNIAKSNPDIVLWTSGVQVYFSHGHIAKGKGGSTEQRTKNAIEKQLLGRMKELVDCQIFIVAHYHHSYFLEDQGRTLFGCPALEAEGSSEYMMEQYGVWSKPGMLGLLVGDCFPRGWAELEIV